MRRRIEVHPNFGKHCYVLPHGQGRVLKVFNFRESDNFADYDSFRWGDPPRNGEPNMSVTLKNATKIQNLCALTGLAPRVHEIVEVTTNGKMYWGQIVDKPRGSFVEGQADADAVYEKVKALGAVYGFKNEKDDVSIYDVMGNQLIDFNTFDFIPDYQELLIGEYKKNARYGKIFYHNVEEWGLSGGPRNNEHRVAAMRLNELDFEGKKVVDFGCAGGWFTRYAYNRGATDIYGLDYPDVEGTNPILAAEIAAIDLECWNIQYRTCDLTLFRNMENGTPWICMDADIAFFFSMNFHIGIPRWLPKAAKLVVFEDNSKNRDAYHQLKKIFTKVEHIGDCTDHGVKPVYWCHR